MKITHNDPFKRQSGDMFFYMTHERKMDPVIGRVGIYFEVRSVANDEEAIRIALENYKFSGTWSGDIPRFEKI